MLSVVWASFFILAFASAAAQSLTGAGFAPWEAVGAAVFAAAKDAFDICLGLAGLMCLWLGLMRIAEAAGAVAALSRALAPVFRRIMPEVPDGHPALGSVALNMAANMLGLDNAATPAGLRAMEQLQELNPSEDTASDAQIMFMVINSSSVMLLPATVIMFRSQMGASQPASVFAPILLATVCSTLAGFLAVARKTQLRLDRSIWLGLASVAAAAGLFAWGLMKLPPEARLSASAGLGNAALVAMLAGIVAWGLARRVPVYDAFVDGAKEGVGVALRIAPHLVGMLAGIAAMRAGGILAWLAGWLARAVEAVGLPSEWAPALPSMVMLPFSGGGSRALMVEAMQAHGADSFPAFVAGVAQGSTETTFYVLAVYCGAVGITRSRHALPCALLADAVGLTAAVVFSYMFYTAG
ncbi:hypothetical protein FACS1894186_6420 [Alphaproteobacteria bacterium]|nr:hypothetical protein FACS1894186_6420 [Alphaproteobacteria bacterium]